MFENTGTDFPVLINAFASEKRMSLALGLNGLDEVGSKINRILGKLMNARGSFLGKISAITRPEGIFFLDAPNEKRTRRMPGGDHENARPCRIRC